MKQSARVRGELFAALVGTVRAERRAIGGNPDRLGRIELAQTLAAMPPIREEPRELQHPDFGVARERRELLRLKPPERPHQRARQPVGARVRLVVRQKFNEQFREVVQHAERFTIRQ
jgi:hypothetical protein